MGIYELTIEELVFAISSMLKGREFRAKSRVPVTCGYFNVDERGQINARGFH